MCVYVYTHIYMYLYTHTHYCIKMSWENAKQKSTIDTQKKAKYLIVFFVAIKESSSYNTFIDYL